MADQEQLIAEWQQPAIAPLQLNKRQWILFSIASTVLFLILLAIGIWQRDTTFYLAAVVVLAAVFSLFSFTKRNPTEIIVRITTIQVLLGEHSYPLTDFSGFWIRTDPEVTIVNLEPKRRSFVPISILADSKNGRELREVFLEVLPEVEPRATTLSDRINSYLHL